MQIDNMLFWEQFMLLKSNALIQALIIIAIIDILTGMGAGIRCKELDSSKGINGVIKHMSVVLMTIVAYPYMAIFGLNTYANWFVGFYIASYGISVLENATKMGIPVPDFIIEHLAKFKNKGVEKS